MIGRRGWRVLVFLTGIVASVASPGQALSHGYAHHEMHEHAADAHVAGDGMDGMSEGAELEPGHDAVDHAHLELSGCVLTRFALTTPDMPASSPTLDVTTLSVVAPGFADLDDRPPRAFRSGPSNPRGPPSLV